MASAALGYAVPDRGRTEADQGVTGPRAVLAAIGAAGLMAAAPAPASAITVNELEHGLASSPMPGAPTPGPADAVWFTDNGAVGKVTPDGAITEYTAGVPAGDTPADSIAVGSDGDLWFCLVGSSPAIGRLDPATGAITAFSLSSNPSSVVEGPDGNVWFIGGAGMGVPAVGYVTPAGHVTEITSGFSAAAPSVEALAPGSDGNMWFLDDGSSYEVGHVDIAATPHTLSESAAGLDQLEVLGDLAAGPDGNMWFTAGGDIGRIALPQGTVTEIADGTHGLGADAAPDEIVAGPDGDIWFDDQHFGADAVGKVVPSSLSVTEYPLTTASVPWTMAFASDGNLYVVQTGLVDQVTTSGAETELPTPSATTGADDDVIVEGDDGNAYFNDVGTGAIVQVDLDQRPLVTTGAATAVTSSGATIAGTVTPLSAVTTASIHYGTSTALGSSAPAGALAAGTAAVGVSATLTGLPASTTIYYEAVASNANGTVTGAIRSFETQAGTSPPPSRTVVTGRIGDQRLTLTTPPSQTCAAPAAKLRASFSTATATAAGGASHLRFTRVTFAIDKGVKHVTRKRVRRHGRLVVEKLTTYIPNATARTSPATVVLSLAGLAPGVHRLTVVASYSQTVRRRGHRRRRTVTKRLTAHFSVC
jgi:streptogramin lyase